MLVLLIWEGAYRFFGWRSWIFPAPSHVIDAMAAMLNLHTWFGQPLHAGWPFHPLAGEAGAASTRTIFNSPLVIAPLISAGRLLVGFAVSILLGGILGLSMWRSQRWNTFIGPVFLGMQTLPSVCWVPLAILTFGINETAILFVLVMGSCFAIAISLRDGLRTIPAIYQRAGLMLGASGWRLYRYVLLPASLPALASSLRQGFSFAWRSLLGAELLLMVEHHGLGYLLQIGRDYSDVAQVVAIMIVMVVLGMLADRYVFGVFERRVHARFGLDAGR